MKTKSAPMPKFNYPQGVETVKRDMCPVIGNIGVGPMPPDKTSGIRTRGNGCATKGTMARGPMA